MNNDMPLCPICKNKLVITLARGRKSNKPFVMLKCAKDDAISVLLSLTSHTSRRYWRALNTSSKSGHKSNAGSVDKYTRKYTLYRHE